MTILTLVTAVACTPNNRKTSMGKSIAVSKNKGMDSGDKAIDELVAANKECLPLNKIVKLLTGDTAAKPDPAAKPAKTKAQKLYVIYVQSRTILNAGAYADDPKLNLLLLTSLGKISEHVFGSKLTSSELVGHLLRVDPENSCKTVSFFRGLDQAGSDIVDTFDVDKSVNSKPVGKDKESTSPGRLTLKSVKTDDVREYKMVRGSLVIDVTERIPGGEACDGKTIRTLRVKTRYVINLSGKDTDLSLSTDFAKLVANTMAMPGILDVDAANPVATPAKPDQRTPNRAALTTPGGGVPVTASLLSTIDLEIQNKNFKEISCKKP